MNGIQMCQERANGRRDERRARVKEGGERLVKGSGGREKLQSGDLRRIGRQEEPDM